MKMETRAWSLGAQLPPLHPPSWIATWTHLVLECCSVAFACQTHHLVQCELGWSASWQSSGRNHIHLTAINVSFFLHRENLDDANALGATGKAYASDVSTEYASDRLLRDLGKLQCTVQEPFSCLKASCMKTVMCKDRSTYIYVMPPCLKLTRPRLCILPPRSLEEYLTDRMYKHAVNFL